MNLKQNIKPISYIKANAAEVLKQINENHCPMIITQNGEARAVLIDTESYDSMIKTMGLLKLMAQGEKDISTGEIILQKDVFSKIEKDFNF